MEIYVLLGIALVAWGATMAASHFLMDSRESAFLFGNLGGLVLAIASGGAYYVHLSTW